MMPEPVANTLKNAGAEPPLVHLENISKSFGKVHANKDITLDIRPGRILALLGENGAGKSTLMSILAGKLHPDSGRILVNGRPATFDSPGAAIRAGIGMVYQHFMLVDAMTVAQNVLLGQSDKFFLSPKKMNEQVGALAKEYGLAVNPSARVANLSMGERQRVEILRLLHRKSEVLIFDEPTTVLTPAESDQLFEALRSMSALGKAVVFISHKLPEVLAIADEIAILRRGEIVDRFGPKDTPSEAELARRMVGREVLLTVDREPVEPGEVVLELEQLSGDGLQGVDLTVRQGEIVAVAGVAGNGQKPLVEIISGLREPKGGTVRLMSRTWKEYYGSRRRARPGPDTRPEGPLGRGAWKGALSYIPEDRKGIATMQNLNLVDNVLLTTRQGFSRWFFLSRGHAVAATENMVKEFDVRGGGPETRAGQLSGGNLQKLVLAREFYREPRIIVAEQPTQGLDVAATEEVWAQLLAVRERAGVLLVTNDLNESIQLADRIAVMYRGRFMDVLEGEEARDVDLLGQLMAGVDPRKS
ncbi:ABC transporter ATP-binding protein [Oceanidesulfovibrio indonesiensis]|uniref:ABC transporter ATP-binding protein n=1 Tax=Oceanidesulfovibrio indonesiensis TaxID=54767 RepID=A0A7M3MIU0_9BACT|nr:ABC transporter ATP-binding protein [Oceanidesulfovibrio indonesiensis]TVM19704.1 ABC transporter ATP-binding protein [Oceanidesulfovibrio indonesiensis]